MSDNQFRKALVSIRELCESVLSDSSNPETRAIGYQAAINLCQYEGSTLWAKFNAMLVANTIVMAFLTLNQTLWSPIAAPLFGLLLCFFWLHITMRSFAQYAFWFASACALEDTANHVFTVNHGKIYAKGEPVSVNSESMKMSKFASTLKIRYSCYAIIVLFAIAYCFICWNAWGSSSKSAGWINIGTYNSANKTWVSSLKIDNQTPEELSEGSLEFQVLSETNVYKSPPSPVLIPEIGKISIGSIIELNSIRKIGGSWWAEIKRNR